MDNNTSIWAMDDDNIILILSKKCPILMTIYPPNGMNLNKSQYGMEYVYIDTADMDDKWQWMGVSLEIYDLCQPKSFNVVLEIKQI